MSLYVEEMLQLAVYNNTVKTSTIPVQDFKVIRSMANQVMNNIAMTESQSRLVLRLLSRYSVSLFPELDISKDLAHPKFKQKFRVLDTTKKIFLFDDQIIIKFPYNQKYNKLINKIPQKAEFDKVKKQYHLPATVPVIDSIMDIFKDKGFEIQDKILELYREIVDIKLNEEEYIPILDKDLNLKNCDSNLVCYFNSLRSFNPLKDAMLAKRLEIKLDDNLLKNITFNCSRITKKILSNTSDRFVRISADTTQLSDVFQYLNETNSYPCLMIMEDNSTRLESLKSWYEESCKQGLSSSNISVLFRSDTDKDFNSFIRENKLNNPADKNKKLIVVKTKIPKFVITMKQEFRCIISLTNFSVHYTSRKLIDSHPNILYYLKNYTEENFE